LVAQVVLFVIRRAAPSAKPLRVALTAADQAKADDGEAHEAVMTVDAGISLRPRGRGHGAA